MEAEIGSATYLSVLGKRKYNDESESDEEQEKDIDWCQALLAEMNKICEARSEDDDIQDHFSLYRSQNTVPDLKFMYSDLEVHEDMYQLMKYFIAQNCSPEQFDKVMRIWKTFVEDILGVSRPFSKQSIANGQVVIPNTLVSTGPEQIHERHGGEHLGDDDDVKPLTIFVPVSMLNTKHNSRVFYGNEDFHLFFRLHQILYSRLKEAKEMSASDTWRSSSDTTPNDSYARFLHLLYRFLDGGIDGARYKDECRSVLGTWSFSVFTLDKLIDKLTKHLLTIAMYEVDNKLLDLYAYENSRNPRRFAEEVYIANSSMVVSGSKIIRFECSSMLKTERQTQFTIRMMNFGYEKSEALVDPNFVTYINRFLSPIPGETRDMIFLRRNMKKYACENEGFAMAAALKEFHFDNGLRLKLDPSIFMNKIWYSIGTADFMVRRGRGRKRIKNHGHHVKDQIKVQTFRKLLHSRIQFMDNEPGLLAASAQRIGWEKLRSKK